MSVCVLGSWGNLLRKTVCELKDKTFLGTGFCLNSWFVINLVKKVPDLLKANAQQYVKKKKFAIEPYSHSFVSWKHLHTLILHEPVYYLQHLPSLEMYIPDPFWYFVICSTFFAKGFHPIPSPRSGWQSVSCPRLCLQHTHRQLVVICKKLPVIAPCGRDKRQVVLQERA